MKTSNCLIFISQPLELIIEKIPKEYLVIIAVNNTRYLKSIKEITKKYNINCQVILLDFNELPLKNKSIDYIVFDGRKNSILELEFYIQYFYNIINKGGKLLIYHFSSKSFKYKWYIQILFPANYILFKHDLTRIMIKNLFKEIYQEKITKTKLPLWITSGKK